jgi:ubiquinone/menaquinone biosynthesis C-methylase UbiE
LVRLLRGGYVPNLPQNLQGCKVLDVGFGNGNGNNTILLASLGCHVSGIEVNPSVCELVDNKLAEIGFGADLRVGTNTSIPFEDETFDLLVSWNVLHYANTETDICAGIAEYARVLKKGGRVLVSTTGPDHKILAGAVSLGGHRHRITGDALRRGQIFYYFDDGSHARTLFEEQFDAVMVGRTHDHLFTETLDWFLITGLKAS